MDTFGSFGHMRAIVYCHTEIPRLYRRLNASEDGEMEQSPRPSFLARCVSAVMARVGRRPAGDLLPNQVGTHLQTTERRTR